MQVEEIKQKRIDTDDTVGRLLIDKVYLLRSLLTGFMPTENAMPGSETSYKPIITDEIDQGIIRKQIMKLIKEL